MKNPYPVYEPKEDARRKLMPDDIARMKELHAMGVPHKGKNGIGAQFGVNPTTVRWHVDLEYRERKTRQTVDRCDRLRNAGGEEYLKRKAEIRKRCYEKKKAAAGESLLAFKREAVRPYRTPYRVVAGKRVYFKPDGKPFRKYRVLKKGSENLNLESSS